MHNIYISGIGQDQSHIDYIKQIIEQNITNTRCWFDVVDNSVYGDISLAHSKQSSIPTPDNYEVVVFVASSASRQSQWVYRELTYYHKMQTPMYAVVVDDFDFGNTDRSHVFKGFCSIDDEVALLSFVRNNLKVEEEYDVFISYSQRDFEIVSQLKNNLESQIPELKCWIDLDGIESGDQFESKIVSAIEKSKILLFAYSANSIESAYAQREVIFAQNLGKRIVPVIIDQSPLSGWFLFRFGNIDYTDINDARQVDKLIINLRRWLDITGQSQKGLMPAAASCGAIINTDNHDNCIIDAEEFDYDAVICPDCDGDGYIDDESLAATIDANYDEIFAAPNMAECDIDDYEEDSYYSQDGTDSPTETKSMSHREITHPVSTSSIPKKKIKLSKSQRCGLESPSPEDELSGNLVSSKIGIWGKFAGSLKNFFKKSEPVYTCVYAPSQAKPGTDIIIQVFLHLPPEIDRVENHAKTVDSSSSRCNTKQLSIFLKNGEVIEVQLSIPVLSIRPTSQSMIWNGHYDSVEFVVDIPESCKSESLLSTVTLLKQHLPVAQMSFKIDLVASPRQACAEIFGHIFKRAFISYSHKDFAVVEPIANQLKKNGIEYFFDKHSLNSGDRYRNKIKDWIELSDLFILCWSKNSRESKEVEKERRMALEIASRKDKSLRICPFAINPKAPIPDDMIDIYNFTEL